MTTVAYIANEFPSPLEPDLLAAKLQACSSCVTVSDFNRRYILEKYPPIAPEKIIVRRLGVNRVLPWPSAPPKPASCSGRPFCLLLSNAAVLVLPSELEGLSLALDAMAAGVCVLTSDILENREVVEGAGFMFRRGDLDDLERLLDVLIHNPELRRQAASRERDRIASGYLWPEIARSIERTYYGVLGWEASALVLRDGIAIPPVAVAVQAQD